jgi:hypothetical protein
MNTLRSPRVGLLHLAVAVCIGGAAVAQAPNFLSAAPAVSFPADLAANASDGLLSLASGYKGEPMGPALPPMSTALLGIVNLRRGASTAASMGGTGTIANPYFNVANPGFDDAVAAESSPWKFLGSGLLGSGPCFPPAVVEVDGYRQYVRLRPVYYDGSNNQCHLDQTNPCTREPVRANLTQELIDAGHCEYVAIAFDVKFPAPPQGSCTYLEVILKEVERLSGDAFLHTFVISGSNTELGTAWNRVTYHARRNSPILDSVFGIEFNLKASLCDGSGLGGGLGTTLARFPTSVCLDNVELKSIPAAAVQLNKRNQVTSGCQSGMVGCSEIYEGNNLPLTVQGLAIAYNNPKDEFAPRACPLGYCLADLNFDGQVNAQDLSILLSNWGIVGPVSVCSEQRLADINMDGNVGAADLSILLSAWGPCP